MSEKKSDGQIEVPLRESPESLGVRAYLSSLASLFWKPYSALGQLFAGYQIARHIFPLLIIFLSFPVIFNSLLKGTSSAETLFFTFNRHLSISSQTFQAFYPYMGSVLLCLFLAFGSLLLFAITKIAKDPVSPTDSLAVILFSLFPFMAVFFLHEIFSVLQDESSLTLLGIDGLAARTPTLQTFSQTCVTALKFLFLPLLLWGLYIWFSALEGLTDLDTKKNIVVIALTLLLLASPFLGTILALEYNPNIFKTDSGHYDYLEDSIEWKK